MTPKPLTPDISIGTQITPPAMAAARAAGFRAVIYNRPDGEEPGQPTSAELAVAARTAGLDYHYIPVVPGQYGDAQIDAFHEAMERCGKPAIAFCKSGMRATSLWALSQAGKLTTDEILRQARTCGYDLTALVPHIEARAKGAKGGDAGTPAGPGAPKP